MENARRNHEIVAFGVFFEARFWSYEAGPSRGSFVCADGRSGDLIHTDPFQEQTIKEAMITLDVKVEMICEAATEKKADEIVVMDMRQKTSLCDYFIVMSATSSVRVKTIADFIQEQLKDQGFPLRRKEGYADALWVLLDYGDVIVHVFYQDTRKFYGLEYLWGDAPKTAYLKR